MRRLTGWLLMAVLLCARAMAQSASAQSAPEPALVVEQLVCRGNASTSCTFILGQVYLAEGDVIDEVELENAKLRLLWLRNFQSVSIYLEKGSVRGRARVIVEVVEAKPVTTELAYGLFDHDTSVGESISGRYTHYNLFGTGKVFDARADIITPFSGPTIEQYFARAQYVDPHLLDSKRNFFSAGVAYLDGTFARSNGDNLFREQLSYDLTFGRRLWDFSYVTVGYQHRPIVEVNSNVRQNDGHVERVDTARDDVVVVGFGWNSEDDAYFPTRGSRLSVSTITNDSSSNDRTTVFYRQNWRWGRTIWSAHYERKDIFGIAVARPLALRVDEGAVRRARWFSDLIVEPNGFNEQGSQLRSVGLNAGVLLETRSYGIVQFQLSYSRKLNP